MASYDENGGDGFTKTGNVTIGSIAGDEARQGTDHEHRLSFLEAIKLYPSAVGWTIYFSLGVRRCQCLYSPIYFVDANSGGSQVIMARSVCPSHLPSQDRHARTNHLTASIPNY